MVPLCLALVLLASPAEDNLKRIKQEMLAARQACGSDTACQNKALQDGMARLKAATAALRSERNAAESSERAKKYRQAAVEREQHGGKSGGVDGQYLQLHDWAAAEAAWKDSIHCLHRADDQGRLPSKAPPPLGKDSYRYTAPYCGMITTTPTERYCGLNHVAVVWHMLHQWEDRYDKDIAYMKKGTCIARVAEAFRNSDDDGFRLAVLDFIADVKANGVINDVGLFLRKIREARPQIKMSVPVLTRYNWVQKGVQSVPTSKAERPSWQFVEFK